MSNFNEKAYIVPLELLICSCGHLEKLRAYLTTIGYPLASNEELNAPDSVIRLQEGYHLVGIKKRDDHNTYYVRKDNEQNN